MSNTGPGLRGMYLQIESSHRHLRLRDSPLLLLFGQLPYPLNTRVLQYERPKVRLATQYLQCLL